MKYSLLPAAALALLGLPGCVDDTLSLAITRFIPLTQATMCMPDVTTMVAQSNGIFDVAINVDANAATGYVAVPDVVNNLVERATAQTIEMDAIDIQGFDIELQPAPEVAKVMNDGLMGQPPSRPLIVHMRAVGLHAGLTINGGYIDFPLEICRHCLGTPDATCPMAGYAPNTVQSTGCLPWQDEPSTCCFQNANLLCGANVPMAMATGM